MAKVLLDLERMRYPHSGLGYYCHCLEQGLSELDTTSLGLEAYGVTQGISIPGHPRRQWHRYLNPTVWGFDVVHITHQLQSYLRRTPGYRGRKVLTLHDLNYLHEALTPAKRKRRHAKTHSLIAEADVIVCISDFVKQDLMAHRELFTLKPSVEIRVIHNGIIFGDAPEECPAEVSMLEGLTYYLSIGVLTHKKQQHLLVELLPDLPEEHHLVLVYSDADAQYESQILDRATALGVRSRVHLLRSLSSQAKLYALQHCRAYLHPSIAEGFGLPPIEAMALGKPVFVSTATSLPEICGDGAYYFADRQPEAMIETLRAGLDHYDSTPGRATEVRNWAMRYDYRRMASQYLEVYRDLAGRP